MVTLPEDFDVPTILRQRHWALMCKIWDNPKYPAFAYRQYLETLWKYRRRTIGG